jgi:hypothetical protein
MQKSYYFLAAIAFLVIMLAAACSAPVPAAAPSVPPSIPTLAAGPTTDLSAAAPSVQPTVANSGGSPAPICQATLSCAALDAQQIELDCVKKVPYTNVLVPQGTNFEVVDTSSGFTCADSTVVVNGKKVISCHGPELLSFELKLTNPSCGGDSLVTGTSQCQQGYGYDAAQQCCAPVSAAAGGSTTVRVNLGGCPIPRPSAP